MIRYLCFRVFIGKEGFYFQSNPFNGRYYRYSEIKNCREEGLRSSRSSRSSPTASASYYYFFIFTDVGGKSTRFQFEKSACEREIQVLKRRIGKAG